MTVAATQENDGSAAHARRPPPVRNGRGSTGRVPRAPFVVVGVAVVVLAAAVTVRLATAGPTPPPEGAFRGIELDEALPRPDFVLTDTDGRPYDFRARTQGQLTLLFFGYTSCPDVCPVHLANLAHALSRPGVPHPVVVFVGVDPERDTPRAVRAFLDNFDEEFVGLTGTDEELATAQEAAGVPPAIIGEPEVPGGDYLVGHSSRIAAYTPDDMAHVAYPFGIRQQDWVYDLPRLASHRWDDG